MPPDISMLLGGRERDMKGAKQLPQRAFRAGMRHRSQPEGKDTAFPQKAQLPRARPEAQPCPSPRPWHRASLHAAATRTNHRGWPPSWASQDPERPGESVYHLGQARVVSEVPSVLELRNRSSPPSGDRKRRNGGMQGLHSHHLLSQLPHQLPLGLIPTRLSDNSG